MPVVHEGRDIKTCAMCHRLAATKTKNPVAGAAAVPALNHGEEQRPGLSFGRGDALPETTLVLCAVFLTTGFIIRKLQGKKRS